MEKRLIAPVIITACIVLFCVLSAVVGLILIDEVGLAAAAVWLVIMLAIIGIHIFILAQRVKEIRSGEEDDLGKY
ncbi:MAG: hypothetical protein FWG41_01570 [Methanomassiliicoccaceae archaeon]|nr:hypothetical protein [Methanomassiliicoccaceae archaeon]